MARWSSIPSGLPQGPMPAQQALEGSVRAHKLGKLINRILLKRTALEYEEHALHQAEKFFIESAHALTAAFDDAAATEGAQGSSNKKLERIAQCQEDFDTVRVKHNLVSASRNDLSNLEYRLRSQEAEIAQMIQSLDTGFRFSSPTRSRATQESSRGSSRSPPPSETPTLLKSYYDRKGDELIYRERLVEFDMYHNDGLVHREMLADRGDPLDIPDETFQNDYLTQRDAILTDLQAAVDDAADLARQCEAAGLSFRTKRAPSSAQVASSRTSSSHAPVVPLRGERLMPQPRDGSTTSFGLSHEADSNPDVIEDWLTTLETQMTARLDLFAAPVSPHETAHDRSGSVTPSRGRHGLSVMEGAHQATSILNPEREGLSVTLPRADPSSNPNGGMGPGSIRPRRGSCPA